MPPIGERLTDLQTYPRISPEEQIVIESQELEIGRRINAMAPPIGGYIIFPLFETDDLTLTTSGCATYEAGGKTVAALVTRDSNNDVRLGTMLYEDAPTGDFSLDEYLATFKQGTTVEVAGRYKHDRGKLHYFNAVKPETFEQYIDTFTNIHETLDLIGEANKLTYGVTSFDGIGREDLEAIREHAEPGLINFIEESFQTYMAARDSQTA